MTKYSMAKASFKNRKLMFVSLPFVFLGLSACGGGGGAGSGATAFELAMNRYTMTMSANPTASVFYGGNYTNINIGLVSNCSASTTTTNTTAIDKVPASVCGPSPAALEGVAGKVVNLSVSDSSALDLTPKTAVTDENGNVSVSANAGSATVSGTVNVTASVNLSGYTYKQSMAVKVNQDVDLSLGLSSRNVTLVLGTLKCTDIRTFIVNVKNASNVPQTNSVISFNATNSTANASGSAADLGVFPNLGRVWQLQVRPQGVCDSSGTTDKTDNIQFDVDPGDGSGVTNYGYEITYKIKAS